MNASSACFRSSGLRVMSPALFYLATQLVVSEDLSSMAHMAVLGRLSV